MKTLLLLAALAVSFASSAFGQDPPPPPAPASPAAAAPAVPAPSPAVPLTAEAPPVARKEESEDQEPGFIARIFMAAAGNKPIAAQLTEKDATIAALTKERDALKLRVDAQTKDIAEATAWIRGVADGSIDPVKNAAPSAAAAAAAQAVQTAAASAVQKVGLPVMALAPPPKKDPAADAGSPGDKEAARLMALDAVWKTAGYDRASQLAEAN